MPVIKLVCNQQIGDCIRTTTVAKLFKEQYPEYDIQPIMSHNSVYDNNPNVIQVKPKPQVINTNISKESTFLRVVCKQDDDNGKIDNEFSIHKLKENNATMVDAMVGYINAKYGFNLVVTQQEPDLYPETQPFDDLPGKYIVVNCGGEKTNKRKIYPYKYWEKLFQDTPDINYVQIGISKDYHPAFNYPNVISKIDQYTIQDTFRLVYNSCGVISGYTYIMHVGAAFKKPVIALGGGGECISWENYEYDKFNLLHTIGSFDCCLSGGCWVPECYNKTDDNIQKCMNIITPNYLIDIIKEQEWIS